MRHAILTCMNHPNLRWSCKHIAFTEGHGYNGMRHIFFNGEPDGKGMYDDKSGLSCTTFIEGKDSVESRHVQECQCPGTKLILAAEDKLVKRLASDGGQ